MPLRILFAKTSASLLFSLLFVLCIAQSSLAIQAEHNVSPAIQQALDQGPADPQEEINLTLYLKMPDQAGFYATLEQLYNPASPTYETWMTDAELQKYAPTPAQLTQVRNELQKHGLFVISEDPMGFSVRVRGSIANVENAFQTPIHQFVLNNRTFRANIQDAKLTGSAGDLVNSISGLVGHAVHPMLKRVLDPRTGVTTPPTPLSEVNANGGLSSLLTDHCLTTASTFTFTTPGAKLPVGVYFGNVYDDQYPTKSCGYTPAQLESHYGLTAAYKAGFSGQGQTIVLMEAYGYQTIESDANAFSKLAGLPPLSSSNFEIVYPEGQPNPELGALTGWDGEIALDVQYAHSIAPLAKIIVVATSGQDNEDFQASIDYVRIHHLGNVISDSWEEDLDLIAGPAELASYDAVLGKAAAQGISVHFSSGDGGDSGLGTPIGAPGVPADNPYATAVGGTSILNDPNGPGSEELGWGNDLAFLAYGGVYDPPVQEYFGGAGGGESVWYPKPTWQAGLPGTGRQTPDISVLADPYTGVIIVLTENGTQYVLTGVGGTSLSCPIFSAFWALANQYAGHSLGQAAPRIARFSADQVIDIVPHTSPTNVAGVIVDSNGSSYYSPSDLFSNFLDGVTEFVSALWPFAPNSGDAVSFGTDSSLTVTKGWDNVTGFGVPNGLSFISGASK